MEPLGKAFFLLTARPIEKDRASLVAFLGRINHERVVLRAPRYKDTMPQELSAFRKEWRMWYAGIDWADTHHDALVIDETGQRVSSLRVSHTPEGLSQLISFLSSMVPT